MRVAFVKPDANVLLRRRGRRGGLGGSEPMAVLANAAAQSGESTVGTSIAFASASFSSEMMKELARLRARLVLVEPDFDDPQHMEREYTQAMENQELAETPQDTPQHVDRSRNEDDASATDSDNATDTEADDPPALNDTRQVGDDEEPRFLASRTFVGARPGYYFGVGLLGLGYHYDEASSHWVETEAQSAADAKVSSVADWLQERVTLLQALTPAELRQVAAAAETREYRYGQDIVTEGQPGMEMFVLQKGSAAVTKLGVNLGRPLATYAPGDAFGERALLLTEARAATVKATEPYPNKTVCLVIGQTVASNLLLKNPQVQEAMRQRAAMQAAAEDATRELLLAEARTLQASVFVELLDGALSQRLVGDRGVAFGPAARGRNYVALQRLEEQQAALELHNQRQQPSCAGEVWYVVSAQWWRRWVDHVNFWQHYEKPGPISNETLLLGKPDDGHNGTPATDRSGGEDGQSADQAHGTERDLCRNPGLKEHEDYVLTCKDVWDCVVSWYGGGPPIERVSVADSSVLSMVADSEKNTLRLSATFTPQNFVVEVYRPRLRVCLRSQVPSQPDVNRRLGVVSTATESTHALLNSAGSNGDSNPNAVADRISSLDSVSADGSGRLHSVGSNAENKRPVLQRARVVVSYDPPNAQDRGKLTLTVGDELEVLDSSCDFWYGRKLPRRTRSDVEQSSSNHLGESWKLWSTDSLEEGRFPSTCVVLVAAAQLSNDENTCVSGRSNGVGFGEVIEVPKATLLSEVKRRACALLGIASLPAALPSPGQMDNAVVGTEQNLDRFQDVTMRAYSRALGFTPVLDESLSVADARLYDGAVICLDVDRPTTAARCGEDDAKMPPEAVPPSRAGLPSSIAAPQVPAAPPAPTQPSRADDQSTDVALHWRDATQRGFKEVLGPLFDAATGVAVVPLLAKDTAPADGSVEKVQQLVSEKLRELETEKRQASAEEDFERALSCKRALADWQLHQTVWSALGQRGVESVEKVSEAVDEIEGRIPDAQDTTARQGADNVDAAERARRGGSQNRRGAVVEGDALQVAGAASVASQSERIRLAELRIGWPQDVLAAAGGVEELLRRAALLDAEDRPLQRAWLTLKQRREAVETARAKVEALAAMEEERRQVAMELARIDVRSFLVLPTCHRRLREFSCLSRLLLCHCLARVCADSAFVS